ncbi:hypothetical protein AB833_28820 [Chromatiales bacterium (ex Bugula neritina AB1)]|nr:hypothetical protein AB833_28820 [Chromatiales bacterium (ex Bugula neritina AB1)]
MQAIDLNADLGESYGPWSMGDDDTMMDIVSSANIACGGHAGDAATMHSALSTAVQKGVVAGAHPGFDDKPGFGRRRIPLSSREIEQLIASQLGTLSGVAGLAGASIRYIKPHGALSNWAAVDAGVSRAIAAAVKAAFPDLAVLAISGTQLEIESKKAGLETYSEIFADRGYGDDGNLVPRSEPGAMIHNPSEACERLQRFFETGKMPTVSGGAVSLAADSICIHGDSAHAVAMALEVRQMIVDNNISIASFK